jgi:NAD(P)-dependent dehydrogenase (short-subunit alcohol dehydrogenase family)
MASTEAAIGGSYIYRTSKAALNNVAKNLSQDLRSRGITVIAVDPGWVKTDMGGPNAQIPPEVSVGHLRKLFAKAGRLQNGRYLRFDGAPHPW